jgi:hypothetical protein
MFTALTSTEVASGKPVSATTTQKIKDNFDDHETRIESLEASIINFLPIILGVNGYYAVFNNVLKTTANSNLTITGVRILINVAGSTGTTQIDVKRSRASVSSGAYQSIFSTLPSVASAAGNDALSSNGVLDLTKVDIQAGDILRLDITSAQTKGYGFEVRIDYTR